MTNHRFKVLLEILETKPLDYMLMHTDALSALTYKQKCKIVSKISVLYGDDLPVGYSYKIIAGQMCIIFPNKYILEGQTIDKALLDDYR